MQLYAPPHPRTSGSTNCNTGPETCSVLGDMYGICEMSVTLSIRVVKSLAVLSNIRMRIVWPELTSFKVTESATSE